MDEGHGTRVRRYSYVGVRKVIKMRDYIVAVDENGQPYLAHAGENGGWKNRATKYLGKFPNLYGNGKTAYAYTQQQLRAMQN